MNSIKTLTLKVYTFKLLRTATTAVVGRVLHIMHENFNRPKIFHFPCTKHESVYQSSYHGIVPPELDLNHLKCCSWRCRNCR